MDSRYFFFKKTPRITRLGIHVYFGAKPRSYIGRIIDRVYDYYFLGAHNLKLEYIRYYRKEFPSYSEFLKGRYNLTTEEAKHFNSWLAYYKDMRFSTDYDVPQLIEDSSISALFKKYCKGSQI